MKKTRIVGLLLVFVLVTSCFVGGTFAKYASTGSGSDNAAVAKWSILVKGTEIAVTGDPETVTFDLFNTVRDTDSVDGDEDDDADVANASSSDHTLIAPGTCGSFTLDIVNNSEVTAQYTISLSENNASEIPLQYSVNETDWYDSIEILMDNDATSDELDKQRIEMLGVSGNSDSKTIYWRWVFEGITNGAHTGQTDASDTNLGITAQGTAPKVTVTATITVEQVD